MRKIGYILAFDIVLVALCAMGVYRIAFKAGFPAHVEGSVITEISHTSNSPFHIGDSIITIASQQIHSDDEIEFLCNQYPIGEHVPVQIKRGGDTLAISATLLKDYPAAKIIIESFAALIFFLTGIAVVVLQKKEKAARIFHYLCIAIGTLIPLTPGRSTITPPELGVLLEIVFYFSYVLVPVLFLHFTLIFPRPKLSAPKKVLVPVYSIGMLVALWTTIAFFHVSQPAINLNNYGVYSTAFTAILILFVILFLTGFGTIIHSYRNAGEEFERRKLRWIFYGIIVGASPFILFSVIPRIFIQGLVVPEEYLILFAIIAPISFAIAIIRFRVFDIDLLVKRSAVYTSVIALLLGAYLGIVWIFSQLFMASVPSVIPNIIGTLLIALLFEPLRMRVQKFIDKKFFRVSYNFHEAQRSFLEEIKFVSTKISLANFVTERMHTLLPVTKAGFFVVESPSDKLRLLAHRNFDLLERRNVQLSTSDLKTGLELPVALNEKIEPGIEFESADSKVFKRWGIALVLPMLSSSRTILGFLVLGEKLSGTRFSMEDISLLTLVSAQSALALERLKVEYALMLEQAESERLNELNKLKSYFVSSVSHDLKTPLTSIRLFAEFLKEHENLPRAKAMEYFGIIEGEADRLARLITNVLDFAKIEKGTKEYHLKRQDLNEIVTNVMTSLDYQINSRGFEVHTNLYSSPLAIEADGDAVFDAMTNLLTNAMKYSPPERKKIVVQTEAKEGFAALSVADEGYGIEDNEISRIFESFYRIDHPLTKSAGGAGLGLSLVKHTMDAHKGKIEVTSEPGKGSIFALYFPNEHPQ